ncbi:C-GCAxxG-C-C family (seleno)protein, partial [Chloroflexota bacterium]
SIQAIINKAQQLGHEYEPLYKGCAQCTFLAIMDALKWGGVKTISEQAKKEVLPGVCLLSGGTAFSGEGTCGAMFGAIMAIGLVGGIFPSGDNINKLHSLGNDIRDSIMGKYYTKYGSVLCKDVQRKRYGKGYDITREDMTKEFLSISNGCTIHETILWAVEFILDGFEKNT